MILFLLRWCPKLFSAGHEDEPSAPTEAAGLTFDHEHLESILNTDRPTVRDWICVDRDIKEQHGCICIGIYRELTNSLSVCKVERDARKERASSLYRNNIY